MIARCGISVLALLATGCGSEAAGGIADGSETASAAAQGGATDAASAPIALDGFLAFSDPEFCAMTPDLAAFDHSLWAPSDTPSSARIGEIAIPDAYREAFGEAEVEQLQDGTSLLRIPVEGSWLGLPVGEIASWHAGYGWDISIIFDVSPAEAEPALRAAGFPVRAGESIDGPFNAEEAYIPVHGLHAAYGDENRASFGCSRENRG